METINGFKRAYVKICTDNGAPFLWWKKKNGEGNFRIITMMADGNLESNWAKSSLVPFQFAEYLFCQYDNDSWESKFPAVLQSEKQLFCANSVGF